MIVGYLSKLIRAQNTDDEKIQKECDWVDKWVSATAELEVFDRMVKELDIILDEPVPELHFLPDGTVSRVRERVESKDKIKVSAWKSKGKCLEFEIRQVEVR